MIIGNFFKSLLQVSVIWPPVGQTTLCQTWRSVSCLPISITNKPCHPDHWYWNATESAMSPSQWLSMTLETTVDHLRINILTPKQRLPLDVSFCMINNFISSTNNWLSNTSFFNILGCNYHSSSDVTDSDVGQLTSTPLQTRCEAPFMSRRLPSGAVLTSRWSN